jgi:7,8-dihydroneopterin aldolase/epimerase/oxygenase
MTSRPAIAVIGSTATALNVAMWCANLGASVTVFGSPSHTDVEKYVGPDTTNVVFVDGIALLDSRALRVHNHGVEHSFDHIILAMEDTRTELAGIARDADGRCIVDAMFRTTRTSVFAIGSMASVGEVSRARSLAHGVVVAHDLTEKKPVFSEHSDKLSIHGLTVLARIGVYPREWRRRQTLTFDVTFEIDASQASPQDALGSTIDYAAVAQEIETLLGEQHFNLIETVADVLASRLLARFDVRTLKLRVTKPGVPQRHASASIEVERRRRRLHPVLFRKFRRVQGR